MKGLFLDCVRATLFTLGVLALTKLLGNIDLNALNTFKSLQSSYNHTDLYYSNFYENISVDTNLVLINIGSAGRDEIGELLWEVCQEEPKVIGLDVSFDLKKNFQIDSTLMERITTCGNIVLPIFDNSDFKNLAQQGQVRMASNLFTTDANGIVKYVELSADTSYFLFSQHLASAFDNSLQMPKGPQEINFFGSYKNFLHFNLTDILNGEAFPELKNKIVLIGFNGENWEPNIDMEDKYFTPLDISTNHLKLPPTPGIVIHANVIKNLLENDFIKVVTRKVDYVILISLIMLLNFFYMTHFERLSIRFFLKCRLFQIFLTGVLAYVIFFVFNFYRIKFGLAEWIIAIIASFELSMIYVFFMNYIGNKFGVDSYIFKKLERQKGNWKNNKN